MCKYPCVLRPRSSPAERCARRDGVPRGQSGCREVLETDFRPGGTADCANRATDSTAAAEARLTSSVAERFRTLALVGQRDPSGPFSLRKIVPMSWASHSNCRGRCRRDWRWLFWPTDCPLCDYLPSSWHRTPMAALGRWQTISKFRWRFVSRLLVFPQIRLTPQIAALRRIGCGEIRTESRERPMAVYCH
jgi:hypothetical protein